MNTDSLSSGMTGSHARTQRSSSWQKTVIALMAMALPAGTGHAQSYNVTTIHGVPGVTGAGQSAPTFSGPYNMARDPQGNIYVAEYFNHCIRKITPAGAVSVYAGAPGVPGNADGNAGTARFNGPVGISADANGVLYVADFNNHTIRKVTGGVSVTTIAGTAGVSGTTDAAGAAARFNNPSATVVDGTSNTLLIADQSNHTVRKMNLTTNSVTTLCGNAGVIGSQDGSGAAARFSFPTGLALESNGNLLVTDNGNHTIRRVSAAGAVTTVAGVAGAAGSSDGTGGAARFQNPIGIVADGTSNTIFITDNGNNTVRQMTLDGKVSTLCGLPGSSGNADGAGANARLDGPGGIIADGTSNTLIVAQGNDHTLRRVSYGGYCSTWIGQANISGATNSTGYFNSVTGVVFDSSGNLFLSDFGNHVIRKVSTTGVITTFAGTVGASGSLDGNGTLARFKNPDGLAIDAANNIYVADYGNHTIRKITPAGVVTTLAGLAGVTGSTDGTGNGARFNEPIGVAVNAAGIVIYVADFANNVIRRVTSAGVVTTFAGTAGASGSADGIGAAARFNGPGAVTIDSAGTNLYICDYSSSTIRKIVIATTTVSTLAGSAGSHGTADGTGAAARFNRPQGAALDSAGNLYIADKLSSTIRKMTPAGAVTTLAGFPGSAGAIDGVGAGARFSGPSAMWVNAQNQVFVGETGTHSVRKITPGGSVSTYAGTLGLNGTGVTDGSFGDPAGIARDVAGNLYVSDAVGHVVRKITPSGVRTIIAGQYGTTGTADGVGSAARFNAPNAIAVTNNGTVYVADTSNHSIRRISFPSGNVTTIAGVSGTSGSADGVGAAARFNNPYGIAIDPTATNLYVADFSNHTIRKIVIATGAVTTLAGQAGGNSELDGTGAAARFNGPNGVTVDSSNANLYVTDWFGNTVRKVSLPGAVVTSLAGLANTTGQVDGTGNAARFNRPDQCVADASGNVFVTDAFGHTLRKVTPAGVVTTLAGLGSTSGWQNGIGNAARFSGPSGIVMDPGGVLYIADRGNQVIRKAARASAKAEMVSPANGSTLVDAITQFSWNAGVGASGYALWIGSAPGGYDIYAGSEGTNLSKSVTIPIDRKIYVTLYTITNGVYSSNTYVYEPVPSVKSVVTSPANGSTLAGSTLSLQWSQGVGVSGYALWIGSSPNGYDLGAVALSAGTTTWNATVPTDGGPVYVTLFSLINGAYQSNTYWFRTASLAAQIPAQITSHANTSTLTSTSVTFGWGNAVGATSYALWIGSTPDSYDLYAGNEGANLSKSIVLPGDGRRIYVTLHSLIGGVYQSNSYWFTSYTSLPGSGAAQITSHPNGSTFAAALTTLHWSTVAGATKYLLWVGTTPNGYDLYAGDEGTNTGKQLTMPNDGRPVYVTLYTQTTSLLSNSYFFTSANGGAGNKPALITTPVNGAGIGGATTFNWSAGSGATGYALWIGSSPASFDLYAGNEGVNTTKTVTMPSDGRKIYLTLYSVIGGVYTPVSYVFTASGAVPMAITAPMIGSTFTSKSTTFQWTTGASSYALWIGRTPRSYDIYAGAEGANLSKAITNLLPSDGTPVYVTLYSLVNGVYQIGDYYYNSWQQP